jgi:hypothetical protein
VLAKVIHQHPGLAFQLVVLRQRHQVLFQQEQMVAEPLPLVALVTHPTAQQLHHETTKTAVQRKAAVFYEVQL